MINKEFVKKTLSFKQTVVAATKYVDENVMRELYFLGIKNFGENHVKALIEKKNKLKDLDIIWHFIGTLQTNKVKQVINEVDYVHSLDSIKLAKEINKYAKNKIKCFIQVNISLEETKHGLSKDMVIPFIDEIKIYDKIEVVGLMTMAPNTSNKEMIEDVFFSLKALKNEIEKKKISYAPCKYLSMGMSNDYEIAQMADSDFLRLGHILFSEEKKI